MMITPNHITFLRLVLAPVISLLLCISDAMWAWIALILFVIAAASDWFDGYLARKTGLTSTFGRVFDSIADKLLVGGCIIALAYTDRLGQGLIFPALAIILREIFIAGLREYTANTTQDAALPSSYLGKIKAALQMVAIGILIIAPYFMYPFAGLLGGLILWISAAISVYTGWQYWMNVRGNF